MLLALNNLLLTRSEEGMSIFLDEVINIPTFAQEVYDVTGAESKVLLAIDMETGSIYAAENYSRNDLSSGKAVDFELLITDVESLKCE